jgi:multidrug resistance efflux pump
MSALLQAVSDVLNATVPGGNLSTSDLSAKQLTIQGERTAVSAQTSAVVAAGQAVSNAKNSLTTYTIAYQKAQNDLTNVQNSAASLVKLKESAVAQAEANLSSKTQPVRDVDLAPLRASLNAAAVAYAKTRLISPIDGVVSKQDGKVGMIISPNLPVLSVISEGGFQLETLVSETDIAKLAVGNKADVTLDAYGSNAIFPATVVKLDPAATTENGVTEKIQPGSP